MMNFNNSLSKYFVKTSKFIDKKFSIKFFRCYPPTNFNLEIEKLYWNQQKLLLLIDGNVYWGILKHNVPAYRDNTTTEVYKDTYLKKELSKEVIAKINFKRLPNISCASDVRCDSENNLIALVENSRKYLHIPKYKPDNYDFSLLLEEASSFDISCDVIFLLNHQEYPAHRYIVYSRCEYFSKLLKNEKSKIVSLDIKNLTNRIFESILKYIYSNEVGMAHKFNIERLQYLHLILIFQTWRN